MDNFDPKSVSPNQWINWRQLGVKPRPQPTAPKIDQIVYEATGQKIAVTDPRLIRWAAEKARAKFSETQPIRMMDDKINRRELGEMFGGRTALIELNSPSAIADKNWKRIKNERTRKTNKSSKRKRKGKTGSVKNRGHRCHCGKRHKKRRKSLPDTATNNTPTTSVDLVYDTLREPEQIVPGSQEVGTGTLAKHN